jgi:phosphate transport system substrate-binding protein
MNRKQFWLLIITGTAFFMFTGCLAGCKNKTNAKNPSDTFTSGTIHISVDESFRPVMEEEIKVYERSYPGSKIIAEYKTEANCFKDLFNDTSNRMIIVTRGLTMEEDKYLKDSLYYSPRWEEVASDAITVIVNRTSNDTLFTIDRLKKQLTGSANRDQTIVFDGLNATSTVRYVLDSILRGQKFDTSVVRAVKSSREVINYVSNNANAVGFVGISWIGNPEDTAQVNMLKKVKIAYVSCDACTDSPYVKPMQASITSRRYPLVRGLYYILKENYSGLGTGFTSFLKYDRGQLIFKRAYLGTRMGFEVRNVKINEKL